jgi:hypothetical protein
MATTNAIRTAQLTLAGRETALADFRFGRLHPTHVSDVKPWARGYAQAVAELAATMGADKIRAMGWAL